MSDMSDMSDLANCASVSMLLPAPLTAESNTS